MKWWIPVIIFPTHWSTEHGVVVPAPKPEFNPPSAEEGDNQLDKHPTKGKEYNEQQ